MRLTLTCQALLLYSLLAVLGPCASQLTPEYFNIARGKKITATATCGYDLPPDQDKLGELFCKLATVPGKYGIQGLECDHCNKVKSGGVKTKDHRIAYAIDGTERWWQSPPLSRGQQYNEVNITIDLGRAFHVAYVVVKTANSPRPGMWILEKSVDNGQTYTPWYYFAPSRSDCYEEFGISPRIPLEKDDQVLCSSEYSEILPFENAEMHISLVNGRPSALKGQFSPTLQEWMRATNVRLRLLKVKTLYGEWLPLAREDNTVTRRFFYSIKDISIGGRCSCNGYADNCVFGPSPLRTLTCNCQKNTCGSTCSECCPGYVQYKWKSGFEGGIGCEACNCFKHATTCYYNEMVDEGNRSYNLAGELKGGGVCINCKDNTFGNNCQYCKHKYYNPTGVPMTSKNACSPCNCDERYSTGQCYNGDGECRCKDNFSGKKCDQCSNGYYGFPDCKPCQCNAIGTKDRQCEIVGNQCPCRENFAGPKCDRCARGFFRFPYCLRCNCDLQGSLSDQCDAISGQCWCRPGRQGRVCNRCANGYFGYPNCQRCSCDGSGVSSEVCDKRTGACLCAAGYTGNRCTACSRGYYGFPRCRACGCSGEGAVAPDCDAQGQCTCKVRYAGIICDRCTVGYYGYPRCIACDCDQNGSLSAYCNPKSGQCQCKDSFSGTFCNHCKPGFYGFPNCQGCSCNPAGVRPLPGRPLGDCSSSNIGQCECKRLVEGQDCGKCRQKSFNLQARNPEGCDECRCYIAGVIGGIELCDQTSGQCVCKTRVKSKRCEICKEGYFGLRLAKAFGCSGCNCDMGGSYSQVCNSFTGQCKCRPNVGGRTCGSPTTNHYHPTVYQILSEIEDGRTPENTPVRFRFDENEFPGYSWRGYGVFSEIQPTVIATVDAKWQENYHMVFHYALNGSEDVTGGVVVRRANQGEMVTQKSSVTFKPTVNGSSISGQFALVAENGTSTQFALRDGRYDIEFTTKSRKLLLDYVTIVPVFYPGPRGAKQEAQKQGEYVLNDLITRPCEVNGREKLDDLCIQYSYVGLNKPGFMKVQAVKGFTNSATGEKPTQVFQDRDVLKELDFSVLALLNKKQIRLNVRDVRVPKSGKYVMLLQYFTTHGSTQILDTSLKDSSQRKYARFRISSCKYTFGCRTVGLTYSGGVSVMDLKSDVSYFLHAVKGAHGDLAVDSFILVPYEEWSTDYIVPSKLCVTRMKVCTRTRYTMPDKAVMVEAGDKAKPENDNKPPNIFDPNALLVYLQGETKFEKTAFLSSPGDYAILIHYYQPHHTTIHSETSVTSFGSERGKTSFKYCPNTSGCRTVIQKLDGSTMFNLREKTVVGFTIPKDKKLWIDYIMFVPKDSYTPLLSNGAPVDRTNDFIEYCSKDDLHVTNDLEFCEQSVFSLSTFYNNGTLPCACDLRGSRSEKCVEFGGQCPCLENVIGRTCTRCKSGYYGFPNCKKCECGNYCDPETGLCKCPPNTIGADCACIRGTFGYDNVLGCQQCRCDASGVLGGDAGCDVTTGQCSCLPTRTGRRCDRCKNGYYDYPDCKKCDCNEAGASGCIATGTCICKEAVADTRCDKCKVGYFHLSQDNPEGCLECWCSGQTNMCTPLDAPVASAGESEFWAIKGDYPDVSYEGVPGRVSAGFPNNDSVQPLYWAQKRGDQTHLYGSNLTFTLNKESIDAPVANIESNGKIISYKDTVTAGESVVEIVFSEKHWQNGDGSPLSRADFMKVLVQVDSLELLASDLGADGKTTFYRPVLSLSDGSQVEKCICPANTTGLSCQNCRAGYFKSGDSCVLCQCNGHSSSCDPVTGECVNCQSNTAGPKCDKCISGFYGDPTSGRADACQPCPCPAGGNFATSCFERDDGSFNCTCKTGFTGERCDECADGYYGDPLTVGCQACQCNGNIDLNAKGNCDSKTGVCLRCLNNTGGDHCELCQDGYYGDGSLDNCQRCQCDQCGSASSICNRFTGECSCNPGVGGDRCTSCQAGTWGFSSCNGCKPCACSKGSIDSDCDAITGQCNCIFGVTGLKCDVCKIGFYGFNGRCKACNCPTEKFCDINTGKCCDPGDTNCTPCPPYHILTEIGCEYCGPCVERLFRRVDKMMRNYSGIDGTGVASNGSEKRILDLQHDLAGLKEDVNSYNESIVHLVDLVDGPGVFDATDDSQEKSGSGEVPTTSAPPRKNVSRSVAELNDNVKDIVDKTFKLFLRAMAIENNATSTKADALDVEAKLGNLSRDSQDLLDKAKSVLKSVVGGISNITSILIETQKILYIIQGRDYTELRTLVEKELTLTRDALQDSRNRVNETEESHNKVLKFSPRLPKLEDTFRNLIDKSQQNMATSEEAARWNEVAKTYNAEPIIDEAKETKLVIERRLVEAQALVEEAKDILSKIKHENISGNSTIINEYLELIDKRIANLTKENELLTKLVDNATDHANNLKNTSEFLQSLLRDPQKYAKKALDAVDAYKKVVDVVHEVLKYAQEADGNGGVALELSTGLGSRAKTSNNVSVGLERDATKTSQKIPELEEWLRRLEDLIKKIRDNFKTAGETLGEVKKPFPKFDDLTSKLGERVDNVDKKAKDAERDSNIAKGIVDGIKLPNADVLWESFDEAMELLEKLEGLVEKNSETIKGIEVGVENVTRYQEEIEKKIQTEVVDRINRIRFNIERSREKIRTFGGAAAEYATNTSAELRIPEVAFGPSMQNNIKFDFKTSQSDARLLFLGSPEEYIAFEVKDGHLKAVVASAFGTKELINEGIKVDDDKWTTVEFEKIGDNVKLKVNDALKTENGFIDTFVIDPDSSVLFVGAPPVGFTLPAGVQTTSLVGGFDQLYINGRKVGLYDVKNFTVAPTELKPGAAKTPVSPSKVTSLYFRGNGYYHFQNIIRIFGVLVTFRTSADNGVILFVAFTKTLYSENPYFVIEIVNGTIGMRYDGITASGPRSSYSNDTLYNDNKDYSVKSAWDMMVVKLNVDGSEVASIKDGFDQNNLNIDKVYVGGIKRSLGFYDIIETPGFMGCISSVTEETKVVYQRNWDSLNAEIGCDVYKESSASFSGDAASLVVEEETLSTDTTIGFSFKSGAGDAVLLNMESPDGEFITIGMEGGELKFLGNIGGESLGEDPGRRRRQSQQKPKLNDGKWHSILMRRKDGVIEIIVDGVVVATHKLQNRKASFKGKISYGGKSGNSKSSLASRLPSLQGQMKAPILVESSKAKSIDFSKAKSKTGVTVGERVVPYYEKDIKYKPVIDATPQTPLVTTGVVGPGVTEATSTKQDTTQQSTSTAEVTEPPMTTSEPTEPPMTTAELTEPPATTAELTEPPATTAELTEPPAATAELTEPPATTAELTEPPATTAELTEPPATTAEPTEPPKTTAELTEPPKTTAELTEPPKTTAELTEPPKTTAEPPKTTVMPGSCIAPKVEYSDAMAFRGDGGYAAYWISEKKFGTFGGLSFEFRTYASHGILFYSADKSHNDFISSFLKDGKVYFSFNTGSGALDIHTNRGFNDGKYHKVTVYRHKVTANLTVDGEFVTGEGKVGASVINGIKYLYFGGYRENAKKVPKESQNTISACLRLLQWHSGKHFPLKPKTSVKVYKCYKGGLEKSVFLPGEGSYIVPYSKFFVGRRKVLVVEIRPREATGLIFAVANEDQPVKGDYLVLEMVNGSVIARAFNGDIEMTVVWTPQGSESLCDNKWHRVNVVKSSTTLSLQIDSGAAMSTKSKGAQRITNTYHPLYVGGVPKDFNSIGVTVKYSFRGCIKSLTVKKDHVKLSNPERMFGNVSLYGCPRSRKK